MLSPKHSFVYIVPQLSRPTHFIILSICESLFLLTPWLQSTFLNIIIIQADILLSFFVVSAWLTKTIIDFPN